MAVTKLERAQLAIIDAILEAGGSWTDDDGEVLLSLARAVFNEGVEMGDNLYKRASLAVLMLERHELVAVERKYRDEAQRANTIERIEVI